MQKWITNILSGLITLYRYTLHFFLGGSCRFWPSCSEYAQQALAAHSPGRALYWIARRLLRCHPFHPGGVDPLPQTVRD